MKHKLINIHLSPIYRSLVICVIVFVTGSCNKNNSIGGSSPTELPVASVTLNTTLGDTLSFEVPVTKDSAIIMSFQAMAKEKFAGSHVVAVSIDANKLSTFIDKYGTAVLLPASSCYLYDTAAVLNADSLNSSPLQINVIKETKLKALTKYVLPVTITTVDGKAGAIDTSHSTLYLIIHTGKSPYVDKSAWSIAAFSSSSSYPPDTTYAAQNVIDGDLTTIWSSDLGAPMPQFVEIDMAQAYPLNGIMYYTSSIIGTAGYPTEVNIQLSMDGQNWEDKGNFTDASITPGTSRTLTFATTNARYIKFTILSSLLYYNLYSFAILSEIIAIQQAD